ncbi:PREDICTED: uncharacterized protein LOC105966284 [Erythranthe guttata]|uniref:uncharacterized protein LOC105966284 n=1 Tax=Erythranthe guttata TaxID=4155 RepID=UPI00064DB3E2|nr:PREDICTED: uncharacterized protein LOC105966284 [Erythranthe guttata]|eukprot:XP_012846304.1 PREDICTED: uncharacterized protein LOC105966284 [Erythranthe guttata]
MKRKVMTVGALASFRKNLPSSDSDSESSEDSSQQEKDVAPPVASPEPASIPDELEDSKEEESSEEEELDLDGKDLSTHFEFVKLCLAIVLNPSLNYSILLSQNLGQDESKYLHTPLAYSLPSSDHLSSWWKYFREIFLIKKGEKKLVMKIEAGTSHPLDARGREQGVNEKGARNEGEAQGAEESSGSSTSDEGTTTDIEETLDYTIVLFAMLDKFTSLYL